MSVRAGAETDYEERDAGDLKAVEQSNRNNYPIALV